MLDMKTVVFSYFITNTLITGFIALLWYQNRKRYAGLAFWLIDFTLQAVGFLLLALRGVAPDLVSIVVGNTLIQIGALCIFIGLERFVGKPSSQTHNWIIIGGFAGLMAYFTFAQPDISIRTILLSAVTILLTGQCGWLMWRRAAPSLRRITRDVGVVFLLYALVAFVRIIELIQVPLLATSGLFESPSLQVVFVFINQLLGIALTFTLILMVTRRLELDVQTQSIERTRAEQVLEESEKRFALAFRSSPYAITITRAADGQMIEVNEGFANITGYSAVECIGKTTLELNLWVDEQDRIFVVSELLKGNSIAGMELRFRRKDGALITGLFSAGIFTLGDETCILSSINDITERKRAELKLRDALVEAQRFREALDQVSAYVYMKDPQSRYVYANQPTLELFGCSAEELVGCDDTRFFPPDTVKRLREVDSRVFAGEQTAEEIDVAKADGQRRIYWEIKTPVYAEPERKTILGLLGISTDITARKRTEAALEEYSERLEQMVEARTRELRGAQDRLLQQERLTMLGQIAGGIGHELRSPLGAIKNAVYLLNQSLLSPDPDVQETMQILNRQVDVSDRIITSLLDLARPQPPIRRETDLREPIGAALSQALIPENVAVCRQFDDALPALLVDPVQLQIVFHNLIRNAVQAMPNGGQLTIAARQSALAASSFRAEREISDVPARDFSLPSALVEMTSLEISFSDTGVGIAPEIVDKIFQPMFTTKTRGLGLGLALCKLIVEAHGGAISVASQVGKGTTFLIHLPLTQGEQK